MYSYQHCYHAGNFADLHKHLILIAVLTSLQQKAKPIMALDLFAGEGYYYLSSLIAQQQQEYLGGIAKLWGRKGLPEMAQKLLAITQRLSGTKQLAVQDLYPGSPAIIQAMLRVDDRAVFVENHPQAVAALKRNFAAIEHISIHKRDAFEAAPALIPFVCRRGLVLLDPNYECKQYFNLLVHLLNTCWQKFPQACYMLWYPLLQDGQHYNMVQNLKQLHPEKIWQHEWRPIWRRQKVMLGSGVLLVNAPWQLPELLDADLQLLDLL